MIHAITEYAFNELVYDFRINNQLVMLTNLSLKNYSRLRQLKRENVENVMIFANAFSKVKYDVVYKTMNIKIDNNVYLRLY